MGQQQLLLLALGALIVTIAIAVAINIFISRSGAIAEQYINDTINDCLRIGQQAQAWARKPAELGGGSWSFQSFSLSRINFPESTNYAKYQVDIKTSDSLIVIGRVITGQTVEVSVTFHEISKPRVTR
ncbi:hypothetical protein JGI7_01467 [Candidatus Kryptonium thompsonii]|mgnify:CR=1 FL=1|jgi:hypothetical protein|uniref:DUF4320 family protein n=1 Tax=Candidatus Kryptonium thompsonii TaxID=1633631 RepID=A0A0P1MWL9_9BACT|nr:hypothetical protein [Candidatus Kryptonium thompsoni]CUS77696.1 hypothetical protein JGI6_00505 [Candidatus Kryptonium thompsoni]CUS77963.1 hypothetical protein JGI12_00153 [Candidatus Kryptonium thompsoni]CUS83749.1 hypothetical protein JGI14_10163 [Candidatus Kryptonium thompsoni]CUS86497.1 hypothetical protein JGI16_10953 [Candidatus Kryptonium thompsoni]CUS87877.1 hypothetical protein JGI15_10394 [Candidatus Kryptonium thompsoni]